MKTITLTVELTYDPDLIHGDDKEAIEWFENDILRQKAGPELLLLHSNEIGDTIGEIKVLDISH